MTEIEMILKMAEMQKKLDEALLEKGKMLGKIDGFDRDRCTFAMIDEIGELVHELKYEWCWWKASQKTVEREKVLEELVDVWHFGLSLDNYDCNLDYEQHHLDGLKASNFPPLMLILWGIQSVRTLCTVTDKLYALTFSLGFTMEEVYNGYIKKNKENYERIANGY